MFEISYFWTRPTHRIYVPETGWTAVVHRAPLNLGWVSRCESGPLYRGPVWPMPYWWRPTFKWAQRLALREAWRAPKR
jgi:hypothetical protein